MIRGNANLIDECVIIMSNLMNACIGVSAYLGYRKKSRLISLVADDLILVPNLNAASNRYVVIVCIVDRAVVFGRGG